MCNWPKFLLAFASIGAAGSACNPEGTTTIESTFHPGVSNSPSSLNISSGSAQSLTPSTQATQDLVVSVKDQNGQPLSGVTINWALQSGNGSLSANSSVSSSSGLASIAYTSGRTVGANQILATVSGTILSASFTETTIAGPPTVVTKVSGDAQTAYVSTGLTSPLAVSIADAFGNPIASTQVDWSITSGSGTLAHASTTTDTSGATNVAWTAAATNGPSTITATIHGTANTASFTETTSAAAPDVLATNYVVTSETTASSSSSALTTADAATFTLSSATTVYVEFRSIATQTVANSTVHLVASFDGTEDASSSTPLTLVNGYSDSAVLVYPKALAAGSHTVAIHYATAAGLTAFKTRSLVIRQQTAPEIGVQWVATQEQLSGIGSNLQLATPETLTFTLATAKTVMVEYVATAEYAGGTLANHVYVDGVEDGTYASAGANSMSEAGINPMLGTSSILAFESLSSGLHTIAIYHSADATQPFFQQRLLRVTDVSASTYAVGNVIAQETTTANTPTGLTTPDTLTFSLGGSSHVMVDFIAEGATFAFGMTLSDFLEIDGTTVVTGARTTDNAHWAPNAAYYGTTLGAGAHTITVLHDNSGDGTKSCWWNNRVIRVTQVP